MNKRLFLSGIQPNITPFLLLQLCTIMLKRLHNVYVIHIFLIQNSELINKRTEYFAIRERNIIFEWRLYQKQTLCEIKNWFEKLSVSE